MCARRTMEQNNTEFGSCSVLDPKRKNLCACADKSLVEQHNQSGWRLPVMRRGEETGERTEGDKRT